MMVLQNFTPDTALLGGALIGLSAVLLFAVNGRIAGASGIISGLFNPQAVQRHWRMLFLLGLLGAVALWQQLSATPLTLRQDFSRPALVIAGLLVGFGTRLGSGCTSGHGICGLALFSWRSLCATLTFMASGFITVFILRHLWS